MKFGLLSNPIALEFFHSIQRNDFISQDRLSELDVNNRAYLIAELAIRKAKYQSLEENLPSDVDHWVRDLCVCYRDLFSNPNKALSAIDDLIRQCPEGPMFKLRLKIWRAHLWLLTGDVNKGDASLKRLSAIVPVDYFWKTELLVVTALGHYFAGRMKDALSAHFEAQRFLERDEDVFFQIFNAAMATRVALKLCDADSFEFFSQKLESNLNVENDSRFRLRHAAYRALILNQIGEHEAADQHWSFGDQMVEKTESALEQGHYYLYRGLSCAIRGLNNQARSYYVLSREFFIKVGSPPNFISELEIAENLTELSNPAVRGTAIKKSYDLANTLMQDFSEKAQSRDGIIRLMYEDAGRFCDEIINGTIPEKREVEFTSVTLSIIDNVSRSRMFAAGVSHFRLVPNFIAAIKLTGISEDGISQALENVLRVKPYLDKNRYGLPKEYSTLASSPEVKNILEFATTLFELGQSADKLFEVESRLKETRRAVHLLHDLRIFSSDLMRISKSEGASGELWLLSSKFNDLIEGFLNSIKTGINPETPGLVSISSVLRNIASLTEAKTKKKFLVNGNQNQFLWVSESLLHRVLLNIIKNGLEAGAGPRPVTVNLNSTHDGLVISIADNGSGIPESVLASISDPSKDTVGTSKLNGSGLGLRSAYECADTIGADIRLVDTGNNGTRFEITISQRSLNLEQQFKDCEVLVIDDSEAVLQAWNEYGYISGLKIYAVSPDTALPILNSVPSSLKWVVLDYDLKLPNGNGATLSRPIRDLGVKVALSTGYRVDELPNDAREVEWDTVLSKEPQDPDKNIRKLSIAQGMVLKKGSYPMRSFRHDLKNEITPLKTIYQYIRTRSQTNDSKTQRYVELFGKSLVAMDLLIERTREIELENGEQWTH